MKLRIIQLFFLLITVYSFSYAKTEAKELVQQAVEDLEKDLLLFDFVQGYSAVYVTQTSDTININQIVCNTNEVNKETLSKELETIMSTKGYVTYLVYNMESKRPGLMRYMADNSMSLILTMEIANSSISYSQPLNAYEIEKLISEAPANINLHNVHTKVKYINLFKDYFPSIEVNYNVSRSFNGYVDKENTAGTLKLTMVNVEGDKYINDFQASNSLMQEFLFRGKSQTKQAFRSLVFGTRNASYFINPELLKKTDIKNVIFRFNNETTKEALEVSYKIGEYETFYNNQFLVSPQFLGVSSEISLPKQVAKRVLLIDMNENRQTLTYTLVFDASLATYIKNNVEFGEKFANYILQCISEKSLMPTIDNVKERKLALRLKGIGYDYTTEFSYQQIANVLCQNGNDYEALATLVNQTYADVPKNSCTFDSDDEIQTGALGERQKVNGIIRAQKDDKVHHITTNIEYTSPSPSFERLCNRFLFNDNNHETLKEGILAYFKAYESTKGEKKSEYDEQYMSSRSDRFLTFRIRLVNGRTGFYTNYKVWYTDENKEGGRFAGMVTDTIEVVYDATKDRILTVDNVFSFETAKEIKALAGNETIKMCAKPYCLTYSFRVNGKLYRKDIYYFDENLFSNYFLKLVDWYKTRQEFQL